MKKIKEKSGITLISLVITIIILLILSTVTVAALTGDNGILTNATYAKFATEVRNIEERVELKVIEKDYNGSGTINEELELNSKYNDLLYIEDGKLVYRASKASQKEKEWLEKLGIEALSNYFTVSFETSGGTEISSQSVKSGKKVSKPANPIKEGHEFDGWYYIEETGSGENVTYKELEFDFNTEILTDYFLYAKYVGEAVLIPRDNTKAFWQDEYRTLITSIAFKKVDNVEIPEDASMSWSVNYDGASEIVAYVVSDGNDGLSLYVVSKYEIFAPWYANRYFNEFINLVSIDFTNFNTSRVGKMFYLFADSSKLKKLNIELLKTNMTIDMQAMFYNCSSIESINLSGFDTSNVTKMNNMFYGCSNLKSLQISNFNTENTIDMTSMFNNCSSLEILDLSNFNTNNVKSMDYLFYGCSALESLELSSFNTNNVTSMEAMFFGCSSLESIDLSGFDTSNVTTMKDMFRQTGLTGLDISNFNTEKVTTMFRMFQDSSSLESINLSNWDNRNVTTMERMFYNCSSLKSLNLSDFNTNQVTTMVNMFSGCSNIEELDLRSFDTANVTKMVSMFYNCASMKEIKVGEKWSAENASTSNMFLLCGVNSVTKY